MTKATSWFWNSTLPSASTICTSPASVGIQARLTVLSVSAVITATTPGTAAALVVSMFLTRACACSPCPGAFQRVRRRWGSSHSFCSLLERHAADLGGSVLNGFDDVLVACAAAQVAGDAEADFVFGRILVFLQKAIRPHDHARGAEAALQSVHFTETFLQRVQRPVCSDHPFNRTDVRTVRLHHKHGA